MSISEAVAGIERELKAALSLSESRAGVMAARHTRIHELESDLAIKTQAERGQRERAERLEVRADRAESELGVVLARADDGTPFRECATCAGKPGIPMMCDACLRNRDLIAGLRELLVREKAAHLQTKEKIETDLLKLANAERDLEAMGRNANELSEQLAVVRKQRDENNAAAGRAEALVLELRRQIDTERTEAGKKIATLVEESWRIERMLRDAARECSSFPDAVPDGATCGEALCAAVLTRLNAARCKLTAERERAEGAEKRVAALESELTGWRSVKQGAPLGIVIPTVPPLCISVDVPPPLARRLEKVVRLLAPFRGFALARRNAILDDVAYTWAGDAQDTSRALDAFASALLEDVELARVYNEALR